jgi:hypothetical protein
MAHKTTKKVSCIFMVLIFGLSLFASGAFARAVCDKEHCKHHNLEGSQTTVKANSALKGVDCCTGSQNGPCDLEKGQALELHDCTLSFARADKVDPSDVIVIKTNYVSDGFSFRTFGPLSRSGVTTKSTPIYIQNASLII